MGRLRWMVAVLGIVLGVETVCAQTQKTPGALTSIKRTNDKPAAIVNGETIGISEVLGILEARPSPVPLTEAQKKELRQSALDMLIDDVLIRQFLQKSVPPVSKSDIDKDMRELVEALQKEKMSLAEFLKKSQQTDEQLKQMIVARQQWRNYLIKRFPDDQAKAYYEQNKLFFDKVHVRASHILVKVPGTASASEKQAALAKIQAIRQEIVSGKMKFEDAARKYSDCPSKERNGDIGPFPYKFVVVEPFARAAFSTKKGDLTDVVTTEFGYHIILVTDRTDGEPSHFEPIKDRIREVMAQDQELHQTIISEQRRNAKIEVLIQ